ncbi:MAG: hypothetical protein V4577_23600 [Bacteroidota bacterium]
MIKPKLNRFDLTMIVISLVIGMGIFAMTGPEYTGYLILGSGTGAECTR